MSIPTFDQVLGNDNVFLRVNSKGIQGGGGDIIRFQFPPKITSDNKGGQWKEINVYGPEPVVIFYGGKPREISMEWTYIVTDEKSIGGDVWNIETISKYVKTLRGYFYKQIMASDAIVEYHAYSVVGDAHGTTDSKSWTFRIDNIGVTHSTTLIRNNNGQVYPLKTDIKAALKFFTTGNHPKANETGAGDIDEAVAKARAEAAPVNVRGLKDNPRSLEWY